jgi:hypothetical protein
MRKDTATVTNAASLMLERMAFRVGMWLSLVAWAQLVYAVLTAQRIAGPGDESILRKPPDFLGVLALLCAAVSIACSAYYLKRNIDRLGAWLFAVWCFVGFFGLIYTLVGFVVPWACS